MDQHNKRVALITGSTEGLGSILCKKLYEEGYRVVGNYRSHEKAELLRRTLWDMDCKIDLLKGDVTDYKAVGRMVETVEKEIGWIDILINNAGKTRDVSFARMGKADWDEIVNANLNGIFNCSRHVIKGMIEQQYGRIINISSMHARKEPYGQTNYSTAKAGIDGFTKSLALEVAHYGITVNTITPGYIGPELVMAGPEPIGEKAVAGVPVGRLGCLEEIAEAVAFLISDKSGFITGYNVCTNGGPRR